MNMPSMAGISSLVGCSFAQPIKVLSSDPLGGGGLGRQKSLRAPLWASCASSTITAPSAKPWQKFTAAVIIGSFLSAEQMAIRSRTVLGGNWDSVTAAGAVAAPPNTSTAPNSRLLGFIRHYLPRRTPSINRSRLSASMRRAGPRDIKIHGIVTYPIRDGYAGLWRFFVSALIWIDVAPHKDAR